MDKVCPTCGHKASVIRTWERWLGVGVFLGFFSWAVWSVLSGNASVSLHEAYGNGWEYVAAVAVFAFCASWSGLVALVLATRWKLKGLEKMIYEEDLK